MPDILRISGMRASSLEHLCMIRYTCIDPEPVLVALNHDLTIQTYHKLPARWNKSDEALCVAKTKGV